MEGLNGLISRDERRTMDAFRASVAVESAWEMPESLAPAGHPLRVAYEAARMAPPSDTVGVSLPRCAVLYVDGVQTTVRPHDRPAILQLTDPATLSVLWSGYLAPPAEPPSWPSVPGVASLDCAAPVALDAPDAGVLQASRILYASGGGVALASGGLAAWALIERARYQAMSFADRDAGEVIRGRANTLFYTAQAGAALAVGLGGAGLSLRVEW